MKQKLAGTRVVRVVRLAAKDFVEDEATTRAAALALYAALSFAPLLVLLLWSAAALGPEAQTAALLQVETLLGPAASESVAAVIQNAADTPSVGSWSAVAGLVVIVFSATNVFAQFQNTLNRVWNVEDRPGGGVRQFLRRRLISMGMIAAVGALLVLSLIASAVVSWVSVGNGVLANIGSLLASGLLFSAVFAALYRVIPDCTVRNRDVLLGGVVTGVLFSCGKEALGLYFGRGGFGSAYAAAGSVPVLLIWGYFSSVVVLFGAELTQAYATLFGDGIQPGEHAVAETSPSSRPRRKAA